MRKEGVYILLFLFLLLLLISVGVLTKPVHKITSKITSKVTSGISEKDSLLFQSNCYDSDGLNYYKKGYRNFRGILNYDICVFEKEKSFVKEYSCYEEELEECFYGCYEGACLPEGSFCEDSDNRSLYEKGVRKSNFGGEQEDFCINLIPYESSPLVLK